MPTALAALDVDQAGHRGAAIGRVHLEPPLLLLRRWYSRFGIDFSVVLEGRSEVAARAASYVRSPRGARAAPDPPTPSVLAG